MPKKLLIIIIIIVIIIAAAGFAIYAAANKFWIFKNNSGAADTGKADTSEGARSESDAAFCSKTKDEKKCLAMGAYSWKSQLYGQIVKAKDEKRCQELVDPARIQSCIMQIAKAKKDESICDLSQNPQDCRVFFVIEKDDWVSCKGLSDENAKQGCYMSAASKAVSSGKDESFCDAVPKEDKQFCLDIFYRQEAIAWMNYDFCAKISTDAGRSNCLALLPPDADKDLLNDAQEGYFGTDPKNPDSDGDGYKDGEEVKNGYNPLGPGKMVQ